MSESQSLQQNQETVFTYWWFDNCNQNIDSHTEKRAMDSTHIVEFSERNDVHIASSAAANVPHSKCRSLAPSRIDLLTAEVDKKRSPVLFHHHCQKTGINKWTMKLSISMNFGCSEEFFHQKISFYPHFQIQTGQLADIEIEKTSLTYLPHVNHSIMDFATISKVFEIIQNRA